MSNIFAEVGTEGKTVESFIDTKVETPADKPATESQPEKKEKVTEPPQRGEQKKETSTDNTSDENIPFNKHPRFKSLINEVHDLKEKLAKQETPKETKVETVEQDVKLPDWWKQYYGEDDQSKTFYKGYLQQTQATQKELITTIKTQMVEEEKAQKQAVEEADKYLNTEVERLKSEGNQFEKNELFKFILDFEKDYGVSLVKADGQYDLEKGLQLMQKLNPVKETSTDTKKKIASETMRSKANASPNSSIPTISRNILSKRGSWRDAVKP